MSVLSLTDAITLLAGAGGGVTVVFRGDGGGGVATVEITYDQSGSAPALADLNEVPVCAKQSKGAVFPVRPASLRQQPTLGTERQ
jgi:hypothetical protein